MTKSIAYLINETLQGDGLLNADSQNLALDSLVLLRRDLVQETLELLLPLLLLRVICMELTQRVPGTTSWSFASCFAHAEQDPDARLVIAERQCASMMPRQRRNDIWCLQHAGQVRQTVNLHCGSQRRRPIPSPKQVEHHCGI